MIEYSYVERLRIYVGFILQVDLQPYRTGHIQVNLDVSNIHPYIQASSPRLPLF